MTLSFARIHANAGLSDIQVDYFIDNHDGCFVRARFRWVPPHQLLLDEVAVHRAATRGSAISSAAMRAVLLSDIEASTGRIAQELQARAAEALPPGMTREKFRIKTKDRASFDLTDEERVMDSALTQAWVGRLVSKATIPGGRPNGDEDYARWAQGYVQALVEAPRSPIAALAERTKRARSHVRNYIHEARVRGLLTESRAGKAGGQLTERAVQILSRSES